MRSDDKTLNLFPDVVKIRVKASSAYVNYCFECLLGNRSECQHGFAEGKCQEKELVKNIK